MDRSSTGGIGGPTLEYVASAPINPATSCGGDIYWVDGSDLNSWGLILTQNQAVQRLNLI